MKKLKLKILAVFLFCALLLSGLTVEGFSCNENDQENDDFYFVHLTDTHVMHKLYDRDESTKKIFTSVIEKVTSFDEKPAFIVITGDLCEWGGSGISGALNCRAFVDCLYEKDDQLYADADYTIPVYTTPGNHDYCFNYNLKNYHRFIDKNHVDEKDRYNVTYGDVKLFFMDSGPNHYFHPKYWTDIVGDGLYKCDISWLEDKLSSCTSEKKIVLMHHPAINKRRDDGSMGGVIFRNREEFIELCETYNVDLVLAGHTHNSRVYDSDEELYDNYPINSSLYSTLYVQSDDCKQGCHYRNVSIIGNDVWLEGSEEVDVAFTDVQDANTAIDFHLTFLNR